MYRKVLVPLDGSQLAECTLNHIKALRKEGSLGEVTLLTVAVTNYPYVVMRPDFNLDSFRNDRLTEARDYLNHLQSHLREEGISVDTIVIEGDIPAQAIVDCALEHGVDLIVIASHGYTGIKKLMFGSVALSVLHDSPVPVLFIKPESC